MRRSLWDLAAAARRELVRCYSDQLPKYTEIKPDPRWREKAQLREIQAALAWFGAAWPSCATCGAESGFGDCVECGSFAARTTAAMVSVGRELGISMDEAARAVAKLSAALARESARP